MIKEPHVAAPHDIECWFCDTCKTLTLLSRALDGKCCQTPAHAGCPTPEFERLHRAMKDKGDE